MKFPFMLIYEEVIRNNVCILEELVVIGKVGIPMLWWSSSWKIIGLG